MNEQTIFLAALETTGAAERAACVTRACAGDAALRRQVEALLAAHDRSGEFLAVPILRQLAPDAPDDLGAPTVTSVDGSGGAAGPDVDVAFLQPSATPGSLGRLGHYEVQAVIGRGGCGIVMRAFDESLHRMVAVKVMAPELAGASPARKRFLREARAAAAVRHENVVSIHAVEDQPIPFLVMEYVAGQTLQEKIDETGPLDFQEVARIGRQIADGLAAAHATGLIHRDIKPANILLDGERVKITDFGLARTGDDASLTQSGVIAGTPLYMSPEQAQGAEIDQRSDLFSLGSVLYVMCCGRPPFRAATTLAVLKRVAEDQPRPIREIIPEAPAWLTGVIAKLHAKHPADRYASAQEVAQALATQVRPDAISPSPVIVPKPAVTPPTAEKPSRGRRWAAAAAVLMAVFAGLGLAEAAGVTNVRGTAVRLFRPDGALLVEVDDPDVSVTIDGEEIIITGAGAKEIRLKPGAYTVQASKDGKVVSRELVTVTRNGRQVVRVSKESGPSAEQPKADSARFKNALGMEFAVVPKGVSWLGGGGGKPGEKRVEFPDDFFLGVYEVTQDEWEKVMGLTPSAFSREGGERSAVKGVPDAELKRFPWWSACRGTTRNCF